MANHHGDFIWYELITPDPDGAQAFYGPLLGWTLRASETPGLDYRLAATGEGEVAGIMKTPDGAPMPPAWLGYVGVDDVDKMVESITDGGGAVLTGPDDIPNVGRFAFVADPQGAMFYVMKGVSDAESLAFSYDTPRPGHCAWNELATTDAEGAKHFYGQRFGWVKDGDMDMGPMGKYEFLRHAGRAPDGSPMGQGMIGAVMPKVPEDPQSHWLYYFRVPDIDVAVSHIEANGGRIHIAPMEIPGGDYSLAAADPAGAYFGLVGSRSR
ncbi:MAG: VOC family protein [Sphingomonadaceae bacterium]